MSRLPISLTSRRTLAALFLSAALTACAPLPSPDVSVRHVPSTDFYNGTRMHLFVFDPREPRSLDARIRLAKAELARDPDCAWAGAPRAVIEDATAKQGAEWKDTLLAAPVTCTA